MSAFHLHGLILGGHAGSERDGEGESQYVPIERRNGGGHVVFSVDAGKITRAHGQKQRDAPGPNEESQNPTDS